MTRRLAAVLLWFALALNAHAQLAGNATWSTSKVSTDITTTSTTLVDSGFHAAVSASTTYEFEIWLVVNCSTTSGVRLTVATDGTGPSIQSVWEAQTTDTAGVGFSYNSAGAAPTQTVATGVSNLDSVVHIVAKIATGTSATYVGISWNVVTAATGTIRAGSKMNYRVL
jgi:hypothetical protein